MACTVLDHKTKYLTEETNLILSLDVLYRTEICL